jgi:hypothetical protein
MSFNKEIVRRMKTLTSPLQWYLILKLINIKNVILQLNLPASQNIVEDCFGAYDWQNNEENIRHYGQPSPPLYKLEKVFIVKQIKNRLAGNVIINYFSQTISCLCLADLSKPHIHIISNDICLSFYLIFLFLKYA